VSDRDEEFTDFVAARSRSLMRAAYLLEGSHQGAEDLLQTALIKTYVAWPRIRAKDAVEAYVRTCLVRAHLARVRRHSVRELGSEIEFADDRQERALASVNERDAMWSALRELPPKQRAALVLRYYEDLTELETAAALGCSAGTVKSQTSRAIARLRLAMGATTASDREG